MEGNTACFKWSYFIQSCLYIFSLLKILFFTNCYILLLTEHQLVTNSFGPEHTAHFHSVTLSHISLYYSIFSLLWEISHKSLPSWASYKPNCDKRKKTAYCWQMQWVNNKSKQEPAFMYFSMLVQFGSVENQSTLGIICFFFTPNHFLITKLSNIVLANDNLVPSVACETTF